MKKIVIFTSLIAMLSLTAAYKIPETNSPQKDCTAAYNYAKDAFNYARGARGASTIEDLHAYSKQAMEAIKDAKEAAKECECSEAVTFAQKAYEEAEKASKSDGMPDGKKLAKKAMDYADDAVNAADRCDR
jgi:hypothetical protein